MKHFKQITYYGYYYENGNVDNTGDHWGIKLVELYTDVPEKLVIEYGDEYHDKGQEKLEGFYDGLNYAGVNYTVVFENKAHEYAELATWEEKE